MVQRIYDKMMRKDLKEFMFTQHQGNDEFLLLPLRRKKCFWQISNSQANDRIWPRDEKREVPKMACTRKVYSREPHDASKEPIICASLDQTHKIMKF
jgi:hypothetical protein